MSIFKNNSFLPSQNIQLYKKPCEIFAHESSITFCPVNLQSFLRELLNMKKQLSQFRKPPSWLEKCFPFMCENLQIMSMNLRGHFYFWKENYQALELQLLLMMKLFK